MSAALQHLGERLALIKPGHHPIAGDMTVLEAEIKKLEQRSNSGPSAMNEDLQLRSLRGFWQSEVLGNLRDARLVSFGLGMAVNSRGESIMEDKHKFRAVLDSGKGIGQWMSSPRRFRRCFQGLIRSYFNYDPFSDRAKSAGKSNWGDLRDYLAEHQGNIFTGGTNPQWVTVTSEHKQVFQTEPCAPYAHSVLEGDDSAIRDLCGQLGISDVSWFLRELILAQVREAAKFADSKFVELTPRLLEHLQHYPVLRGDGLAIILNRYVNCNNASQLVVLRDRAVEWWGNPWLPSTEAAWGRVDASAREMISVWLKSEFIHAFFSKLASDGVGDKRRANFWLRYVKSMNVHFALGSTARNSRDRDFMALKAKMKGLFTSLSGGAPSNNAFIMTLGKLVAVEFGDSGNAFYGYDKRNGAPFDHARSLSTVVDAPNSLKSSRHFLKLSHQDGIHGYQRWEHLFEARLRSSAGLEPDAPVPGVGSPRPAVARNVANRAPEVGAPAQPAVSQPKQFTRLALAELVSQFNLRTDDLTRQNGNLWVRTTDNNAHIRQVLIGWGFTYKPDKGWWKKC